jgi:hypothetical protein
MMQSAARCALVRLFCPKRKDRRSDELASGLCVCIRWVRGGEGTVPTLWPLRWQRDQMEVLECMRCQRITFFSSFGRNLFHFLLLPS